MGVAGKCPLPPKIFAESDFTAFETFQLWQISAYNISTVRDSKKVQLWQIYKLTMGCSTSYRWSAYINTKSPKGGLLLLLRFLIKIKLESKA